MSLENKNKSLYTKKEEKKKGDSYAQQLLESHKLRFEKFINALNIKIRDKITVRNLYKEVLSQKNIYNYYDVDIFEFTMAMIQGKLHLVAKRKEQPVGISYVPINQLPKV